MKTILYNPIFINPQAYYVFPRLTRYLQPDNESTAEPANYIGTIEVKVIAYGDTTLKRTYTNTDSIDLSEFKNTWIHISLFTKVGSCVLGEWKIGNMESDLPYIDPEVLASLKAVVIVGNKTNNDSDRAIVKNLVDPDNPFVISNAAFKLNSGFGKYSADFESFDWAVNISQKQHNKATISLNGRLCNHAAIEVDEMKVNIIGNVTELIYWYIANPDDTTRSEIRLTSGINTLPKSYAKDDGQTYNIGFAYISGDSEITIEQIPSFEGAFFTDGVNDLITSTKTVQEMLGGSNELTIVSMIHQVKDSANNVSFTNYIRGSANGYFRNIVNNYGKTGIYGYTSSDLMGLSVVNNILGDKNDYTSNGDNRDSIINGNFSVQGYSYNDGNNTGDFSSVAWYWTIIANKVLTTDQINQVIAYFNLDRTLNPDILCNTIKQGITNENHAEFGDKLIDFSGNGRDIQLNNIGWKGDSGIGKYEVDFLDWVINSPFINERTSFTFSSSNDTNNDIITIYQRVPAATQSFKIKAKLRGRVLYRYYVNNGDTISISYYEVKEGINILPDSADPTSVNGKVGFVLKGLSSVKVEQVPFHAGALCLDGVNDFGKVTGMPIYKDYTFISKYQRLSYREAIETEGGAVIASKSYSRDQGAFIFNGVRGDYAHDCYSFGLPSSNNLINDKNLEVYYQTKYTNQGKSISSGNGVDSDILWLGTVRDNDNRFLNGAIYYLMSFPYSMSKFLIERQLKKHKLGTLYPNMVEFRPVIKKDDRIKSIKYYIDGKTANIGQYYPIGTGLGIAVETVQPYMVKSLKVNGVNTIPNADYKGFNARLDSKSPQKITMDIQVDTNLIQWNPIITSTVELTTAPTFAIRGTSTLLKPGDWIPKNSEIWVIVTMNNLIDELRKFSFNGTFINIPSSSYNPDTGKYGFPFVIDNESTQNINLTIDEYIRYEDIVQPYPVLLRFNDENGNEVSWGGKFRVGSTITRIGSFYENNLIDGLYIVRNPKLNGNNLITPTHVVEKSMVFTCDTEYLLDNNEPKCILSPSRLRIPNSSYKLLGYIPDISGHGNHGKINNSAYAEGSGVNEDGSYQFDGVDDFVTIPTLSRGGKQMLMKVNWNTINSIIYDQRGSGGFAIYCSDYNTPSNSITVPAYRGRNAAGTTYIDGIRNEYIIASQLRNVTHNIVEILDTSYAAGNINPIIGKSHMNSNYGSLALYDFMLFDNISTDDKIKQLNEYVGIEAKVELPPYYWDAYGKTNLDADKATIQQRGVAVGDYDLTNYNHAYEGMSGYNDYPIILSGANRTYQDKASYVNVVGDDKNVINLTRISFNTASIFSYVKQNGVLTSYNKDIESFKIKVTGIDYSRFVIKYSYISEANATAKTTMTIASDSIYELPKSFASDGSLTSSDVWIGINFTKQSNDIPDIIEDVNVTIEVLPEYENGLVYDGIEDFSDNKNVPIIDDFTVIAKRTWLQVNTSDKPFIIKGDTLYPDGNKNAFLFEYGKLTTYSFGQNNKYDESVVPSLISYATPTSYNGTTSLVRGSAIDTVGIDIAHATNIVLYKLILYPKTIPLLQINFLKNLMEKDEIIDLNNPIFIQE